MNLIEIIALIFILYQSIQTNKCIKELQKSLDVIIEKNEINKIEKKN